MASDEGRGIWVFFSLLLVACSYFLKTSLTKDIVRDEILFDFKS